MKNKRSKKNTEVQIENDDESPSSCETRRRIEDLLEKRRYQDELGDFDNVFDMPLTEEV